MDDTYCGKKCEDCASREALNCPGCQKGPGSIIKGDCPLAICCVRKCLDNCKTCNQSTYCELLSQSNCAADERLRKAEQGKLRQETNAVSAGKLTEEFRLLFWLWFPLLISGLLSSDSLLPLSETFILFGNVLNIACYIAYAVTLLFMASSDTRYRSSGIFLLLFVLCEAFRRILSGGSEVPEWAGIFDILSSVLCIISKYFEINAHSGVLEKLDSDLSDKWKKLLKIDIASLLISSVGALIISFLPILGTIATLAGLIGILICEIIEIVYLKRSADSMRLIQTVPFKDNN